MFATVPDPIPARMRGLNRAEICDVNFQELVRWMRAASASCSNRSWFRAIST